MRGHRSWWQLVCVLMLLLVVELLVVVELLLLLLLLSLSPLLLLLLEFLGLVQVGPLVTAQVGELGETLLAVRVVAGERAVADDGTLGGHFFEGRSQPRTGIRGNEGGPRGKRES